MIDPTSPQTQAQPTRTGLPRGYVWLWGTFATISLAYLIIVFTQPATLAGLLGYGAGPTQTAEVVPSPQDTAAEVKALKENLGDLQSNIDDLRSKVDGTAGANRSLESRVAALEVNAADAAQAIETSALTAPRGAEKLPGKAPVAAPVAEAKPVEVKKEEAKEAKAIARSTAEAKAAADKAAAAAKEAAAKAAKAAQAKDAQTKEARTAPAPAPPVVMQDPGLETGSVERPGRAGFGTTVTTAPQQAVGIRIATGPSVDSLRLSWTLLSGKYGPTLGSLSPRYVTGADASGLRYDLIAGPIASAEEAKRICRDLGQQGTPCRVSGYSGANL